MPDQPVPDQSATAPVPARAAVPAVPTDPAKHELMVAAEQAYAEHGAGVSLRDIAQAAGHRNNSAVNYHFGSRQGLEEAIVLTRAEGMETYRAEHFGDLAADAEAPLRDLARAFVEPILVVPGLQGSTHYARFVEVVRARPALGRHLTDPATWPTGLALGLRVGRHLTHLDLPARRRRMDAMTTVVVALAADAERAGGAGEGAMGVDELVDALVGFVTA